MMPDDGLPADLSAVTLAKEKALAKAGDQAPDPALRGTPNTGGRQAPIRSASLAQGRLM